MPPCNTINFISLAAIVLLACTSGAARADALPAPQPVMLTQASPASLPLVDRVVVRKGERRLLLMHGGNVVRSYHVALGLNPLGQKQRSGDFRTPEGTYRLERRNPRSDYFLSIRVSYPNAIDLKRARSRHWDSGGSIMIHGLPNLLRHEPEFYATHDWTDGCIAVSNADMVEIWMLTPDDVPIDILP
ncbi:MAG TPA: L,D-transpeptidase family protein [Steroidobacteraceae bacterium]|jgi:murein L,D-transpeptidase YafK|nr:L,D-transpeptidase family protein [Steroidobacteraceae bacterium]